MRMKAWILSRHKNAGDEQSEDSDSNDEEQQEDMVTDFGSQDQEDEKMQCDSNSQENQVEEMLSKANIEGDGVVQQETSGKNITPSIHKASVSSTTERQRSDFATAEFEGFDIRPDFVPTLQKIWQKHGNILENSAVRSDDIIARGLESLATMIHILGDNSAMSLNDSQASYLVSSLSDLRYMRFKVDWLIPFVEKAEKLHKSKALVESLNNLSQLSFQAKERREMLLSELTKLDLEENKRKEEMAKVSKMIPFCGQVKFDELLGTGLI